MRPDAREYVLGTHDAELRRLHLQHTLWSAQATAIWELAGFRLGQTILDVGCGPGFAALDLARRVGPAGRVIAVDESERFLAALDAQRQLAGLANIEVVRTDVQRLELAPESADGAYARWVLCWVADPESAVAGLARAMRPGGVVAIQDYFNYRALTPAPRSAAFDRVVAAVLESYRVTGGDSDVAGRLPAMLARHGLRVREIRPIQRVARPGEPLWQWPETFFFTYGPRLVQMGLLTDAERLAFEEEWRQRSADPHTYFFTPPVIDIVAEK